MDGHASAWVIALGRGPYLSLVQLNGRGECGVKASFIHRFPIAQGVIGCRNRGGEELGGSSFASQSTLTRDLDKPLFDITRQIQC